MKKGRKVHICNECKKKFQLVEVPEAEEKHQEKLCVPCFAKKYLVKQ